MPIVLGVGRAFGFFGAGILTVGNFIRSINYGSQDHRPTDITFNSNDEINLSVEGIAAGGNYYARIVKRDEVTNVYDYPIYNTSNSVEDFSILSIDIDSSNDIYGAGYYELNGNVYPAIVKFDSNGNILWSKYDSNASGRIATSISTVGTYTVIAGGDWDNTTGTVEPTYIAKIDNQSQIIWQRDVSDSGGIYTNFDYNSIKLQSDGSSIIVGDFDGSSKRKGLITKYNSSGALEWNKTIEYYGDYDTYVKGLYVDGNDQIYAVGYIAESATPGNTKSFVIKYTKEGNVVWQTESTDTGLQFFKNSDVFADDEVGSVYTTGTFVDPSNNQKMCLTKYDEYGNLLFRRTLDSDVVAPANIHYVSMTGTNTDIYVSFSDEENNANVLYGRFSVSGNGLGDFEYTDGAGNNLIYELISTPGNAYGFDVVSTLEEGTFTLLTSSFISYPYTAAHLLLDDYATIYNAKSPVYEDNGQEIVNTNRTPNAGQTAKISSDAIVYDSNLLLNYDFGNLGTYDATANTVNVFNLSSSSFTGTINGATFNSNGYFVFNPANTLERISFSGAGLAVGTGDYTIEMWIHHTDISGQQTYFTDAFGDTAGPYFAKQDTTNVIGLYYGGGWTATGSTALSVNTWYHVAVVRNSGTSTLYLNASSDGSGSDTVNITNSDMDIGDSDTSSGQMKGYIGETRFYNKALTSTEVSQNFNATRAKYGV